ncbi:MAG: Crp/Fnr family transcriptional regulator [Xylophilus sp.]|nr:Crp/Fnr family transcriptional regulator [Xylophilus sp.]MBP6616671.1 Crp/Fnr family transcriptional regulator [Burkholderiaceae bacterium]MBP6651180.1 Crp/Fnr family transcriptional regulator [Xylophilus sp.]MBP7420021.1 Crp/Fnr family transcriptional regulator [Burkholderiaceae bacterium]MBP8150598.1 Crp/Fnr family transcriptional regulator [Xylophilus sp.]
MNATLPRLWFDALHANPWFAALPAPERQALLAEAEVLRLPSGAMLFHQGDAALAAGGGFYALVQGLIKVSTVRQDGREAILAVLEPGNWFGEISLLDGSPRTHDATALTAIDVLVVPPAAFTRQMQGLAFAQAIAALLAARVRGLYGLMEDTTLRGLRARVAHRLLTLARGDATQSPDVRPAVSLPQEALAMMLGITRQTLSKELAALARDGVLKLGYRRIEIVSVAALEAVVHDT